MSKKFPGLGLGNPHRVRPKTEISRLENHVLKNSMSRFWGTPPVQANSRWPKLRQLRIPQGTSSDWKNLPGTAHTYRQTNIVALIYRIPLSRSKTIVQWFDT
jgi:hypothetical protein